MESDASNIRGWALSEGDNLLVKASSQLSQTNRSTNKHTNTITILIMGCTESAPVANAFERVHKPLGPSLGANFGVSIPTTKQQLIVKEKLFCWSGDSFKIKHTNGQLFGNGLGIRGKAFSFRDQMVLEDANRRPVLVCLRKFQFGGQSFKIYTTKPNYPGQQRSTQKLDGMALYTYASVERRPMELVQSVSIETAQGPRPLYKIHRVGAWFPKKRSVKHRGEDVAFMEGGTWGGNCNTYRVTIAPGIDACLMVCLCAICDEMDEK